MQHANEKFPQIFVNAKKTKSIVATLPRSMMDEVERISLTSGLRTDAIFEIAIGLFLVDCYQALNLPKRQVAVDLEAEEYKPVLTQVEIDELLNKLFEWQKTA